MPELPEVETVVRGLRRVLGGKRIMEVTLRRGDLRFPFPKNFAARLAGQKVIGVARRAKYILAELEDGVCLLIHLGMSGRFSVRTKAGAVRQLGEFYYGEEDAPAEQAPGAHDHVEFNLENGTRITYTDPRRFGMMDIISAGGEASHKLLKGIGVEPLGNELNAAYLAQKFKNKKAPLKAALLDQRLIAGLGNIYVCEALFRGRLSPKRRAGTLARGKRPDPRLDDLVRHIRDILNEAIAAGGSTLRDFSDTDGADGGYQRRFAVYGREGEPCPRCGKPVKRIVQSGRSTFYCSNCQK